MLSFFRRISLVAAALIAGACDSSDKNPTGPLPARVALAENGADRVIQATLYDLTDSYTAIECENGQASELVALQGQIFERFTIQYNPAGNAHVGIHTMPVGVSGVGAVSGDAYRVSERESSVYHQNQEGWVGSYRQVVKLVNLRTHARYSLIGKGHYAINESGEVAVGRDKLILKCQE